MEEMSNFKYIWSHWIVPAVYDLYDQMDDEFRTSCSVKIRDLDEIYKKSEGYYQRKRREVKEAFYGGYHKGDSGTEHRMDFHKIGAIICRTLIEYKVYEFDENICKEYVDTKISPYDTDWVVRNALINFRLAFYSSVIFLFRSMQYEYYRNDKEMYNLLNERNKLDLYDESKINSEKVKESFENCIVLDLAKRDIGNHSFDYFMYAIILYQLEEYNKNLLSKEKIARTE